MKIITGKYNSAKIFATTIEESCEKQILELCNESWTKDSKISIMPDCHSGKGCVIGTTMTITDKVVPNLVGVDIGCGMLTVKLGKINIDLKRLDEVIKRNVPMGISNHSKALIDFSSKLEQLYCKEAIEFDKVNKSAGTTGSGNHFIEIDKDDEGNFYLVIHSGSRNFGKRVADYYQDKAIQCHNNNTSAGVASLISSLKEAGQTHLIEQKLKELKAVETYDLAYVTGEEYKHYLNDMAIAQDFASRNRSKIADIICMYMSFYPLNAFETIHNYIDIQSMILRKGAISAEEGEMCLIPINMRDGSLICIGKGNPDFNYSAPHGAGRLMSRSAAKKKLSLDEFKNTMQGIYSSTINESTIDEAPMAYKPIEEILENIKDTVEVIKHIKPVYNIKSEGD